MEQYPHLNAIPHNEGQWFSALQDLARYLRGPSGCPWDQKQTTRSFAGYLEEEVHEFWEALDANDNADSAEEFGDILFCLLATAACAEEEGRFKVADALQMCHEKMIRRHEHVFGNVTAATPEEAVESWNRIKAEEKRRKGHPQNG